MKINKTLSLIAVVYLLINLLFYLHASSLTGGADMGYIFIFPAFWIITLITVFILSIKNRKIWFRKQMLLSSLVAIFFCTPISISSFVMIVQSPIYLVSSGYNGDNKTLEEWLYRSSQKIAITKYWRHNKKDSTWVYFNNHGDTIKTEFYRSDTLIKTKVYKDK
jgi:hypothetical protein